MRLQPKRYGNRARPYPVYNDRFYEVFFKILIINTRKSFHSVYPTSYKGGYNNKIGAYIIWYIIRRNSMFNSIFLEKYGFVEKKSLYFDGGSKNNVYLYVVFHSNR